MCVCVCVRVCAYMHACVHVHICVYVCSCVCGCAYMHVCVHVRMCIYVHVCSRMRFKVGVYFHMQGQCLLNVSGDIVMVENSSTAVSPVHHGYPSSHYVSGYPGSSRTPPLKKHTSFQETEC